MRHTLDFEKTISDLQDKIAKLKDSGSDKTSLVEVNEQIEEIKVKIDKKLNDIYKKLTPWHKLQVARHPERPHFLDYVKELFKDFEPLSGDRLFKEDPALLCGFATFDEKTIMLIGHEKGKNTEERIKYNFGMARPEGYRKAIRLMRLAEKFNIPIVTFVDTPGAYPGVGAEQRGQSVISPEGCASILWKDTKYAEEAASSMKITAQDLKELNIIDSIIVEPVGGAHRNPIQTIRNVGSAIKNTLKQVISLDKNELINSRRTKYLMTINKS